MYKTFNDIVNAYFLADIKLPDQWWDDRKVEFIYNSNRLEGNRLKLADTHSIINDKMSFTSEARFKDILEVKGHLKAIDSCIFMSKNNYPLTEKMLKEINKNLLSALWKFDEFYASYKHHKQEIGEYKLVNNSIKYVLDGNDGTIEPLSNSETVIENMRFVFEENDKMVHVLEKTAHLAFQIWINQPFPDGNKRTARLAVMYLLLQLKFPLIYFKSDGYHFNEALLRCYEAKNIDPLIAVISTEIMQQLSEIMELDKKLKIKKKPPLMGSGNSLIF